MGIRCYAPKCQLNYLRRDLEGIFSAAENSHGVENGVSHSQLVFGEVVTRCGLAMVSTHALQSVPIGLLLILHP